MTFHNQLDLFNWPNHEIVAQNGYGANGHLPSRTFDISFFESRSPKFWLMLWQFWCFVFENAMIKYLIGERSDSVKFIPTEEDIEDFLKDCPYDWFDESMEMICELAKYIVVDDDVDLLAGPLQSPLFLVGMWVLHEAANYFPEIQHYRPARFPTCSPAAERFLSNNYTSLWHIGIPVIEFAVQNRELFDQNFRRIDCAVFTWFGDKIAIEIDGKWKNTDEHWHKRHARDHDLESYGWIIRHYTGSEVNQDDDNCIARTLGAQFGWRDLQFRSIHYEIP